MDNLPRGLKAVPQSLSMAPEETVENSGENSVQAECVNV